MKYAQYDENGNIIGFYDDRIHSEVPPNSISITDIQWRDCINNPGKWIVVNGELQLAPPKDPDEIIREAKDLRSVFLNNQYNTLLSNPVEFTNANNISSIYDSSDLSIERLDSIILVGIYDKNVWNDHKLRIVSPFTFDDISNLFLAINIKRNFDPTYIDLLEKLNQVENSTTLEQIESISFWG